MLDARATAVLDRLYAEDAAQRAAGLPRSQRTRNVDRETGEWLNLLIRATGAGRILEIGSSNAVSTILLADAARANGGRVTGTEIIPERAAEANRNLEAAGLAEVATVIAGAAQDTIASLEGPFDIVFIDAEKDDYSAHLLAIVDRVRPGGLILADNVVSHDVSAYQRLVRERDDLETVTIPLNRGIEFTLKRG
ncbi:MAG: class I SAM-dependent methyltransferase [Thermomicrobiales bacterium]